MHNTTEHKNDRASSLTQYSNTSDDQSKKYCLNNVQPKLLDNDSQSSSLLKIIPDIDSPRTKTMSGFLIGTPLSIDASSSASSTSSQGYFAYDSVTVMKRSIFASSSSQWPSVLRRHVSLVDGDLALHAPPSTPYTPPPMLSSFRRGSSLYFRLFSEPNPSTKSNSTIVNTALPTFTPIVDESTDPKINIGHEYQAIIPDLRINHRIDDDQGLLDDYRIRNHNVLNSNRFVFLSYFRISFVVIDDELLFSPTTNEQIDEQALETFEKLYRTDPFIMSSRHTPCIYPLELVYMLLHEYQGDLQHTLTALATGQINDVKECRPLHRIRFPQCDSWTKDEIHAYTKAMQTSEKNFACVSQTVDVAFQYALTYMQVTYMCARLLFSTGEK
jgi:hypothetical protein